MIEVAAGFVGVPVAILIVDARTLEMGWATPEDVANLKVPRPCGPSVLRAIGAVFNTPASPDVNEVYCASSKRNIQDELVGGG